MKARFKNLLALTALLTSAFGLFPTGVAGQTLTTLYSFTNSAHSVDVSYSLVPLGNALFGVAIQGGASGAGMVFRINTDGTCFTNLHNFSPVSGGTANIGGAFPSSPLVLSGNMLYGVTFNGGTGGEGVVYGVDTGGLNFTNLHDFSATVSITNSDGALPQSRLTLIGNTLYGATEAGGVNGAGALFSVNTDSTGFTNIYSFATAFAAPESELIFSSNKLYGTTSESSSGAGGIFAINTNGTGYTNFYTFSTDSGSGNSDGANPAGDLALIGNTLYGIAQGGGTANGGTIFKINTDGSGFANLHSFSSSNDGSSPAGGVFLGSNVLYGSAAEGGPTGWGTVYKLNLSNTNYVVLHYFSAASGSTHTNSDGAVPEGAVILVSNKLYGTTGGGGLAGDGTVYSLTLPTPPPLAITSSGSNVELTWPTNAIGFILQSATNLASPAVWGNVSPAPVVVNAQNTVTNPVSGKQTFYRLSQ
jgi:uncharacterized repeat protein (TIGR03803 family)